MPLNTRFVNANELRDLFNSGGHWSRTQTGEYAEHVEYEGVPASEAGQSGGTVSQRVTYTDATGRYVATVHQYLRPDGTLGGDPKLCATGLCG